jgi:orotate phosphoribosyltransferase
MQPDERSTLARRIYTTSHLRGRFLLRSGVVSEEYFDKYLFESDPVLLRNIAEALCDKIPAGVEALAGLEMGGIPIATMLSQLTGIPALFVRKKAKEYGTCKLAEGRNVEGARIVIVEDVITSGGQIIASARDLRALGADIQCVLGVIDREAGGVEKLRTEGLELRALFTMSELKQAASATS